MNTKISYLYRDADNYKNLNQVVIPGLVSSDQISTIMDCLNEGEYFIPEQVGLPEDRGFEESTEADHCWFELCRNGFEPTDASPNWNMTPDKLVEMFMEAKGNWNDNKEE